jgi:4-amino-4-deoxychorismate lyase
MMLINGKVTTQIDAQDRGLSYGDGLFETLAIIDGRPQLWQQHIQRLQAGCARLGIIMPAEELLHDEIISLYQRQPPTDRHVDQAVVKVILTRGKGERGYRVTNTARTSRIIILSAWPEYPHRHEDGISVRWCNTPLGLNPALAGIKHLNRLEQVMARNEWQDDHIAEGLMLDVQGRVIEGTMSNLFIVKNQQLQTARLDQCGIAGIIRQLICDDSIGHGLSISEQYLNKTDILAADEVFVCNSLIGIWPVKYLYDLNQPQDYIIGPVSQHVSSSLRAYLQI